MAYPLTPTEFPNPPTGLINARQRLRLVLLGFTAETLAPPIAPTSPFAFALNATVTINWLDGQGNVGQTYKILRRVTSTPPYVQVGTSGNGITAYVDNTVTNGISYEYVVVATNAGGDSPQSTASNAVSPSGGGGGAQGVYSGVHGTPVFSTGNTYHQG